MSNWGDRVKGHGEKLGAHLSERADALGDKLAERAKEAREGMRDRAREIRNMDNRDFFKGVRGKYPSLEEALSDPRIDPQHILIDLKAGDVDYDPKRQEIDFRPREEVTHIGKKDNGEEVRLETGRNDLTTVFISPQFQDYMQEFGDRVRYVTRNGTPWLTPEERQDEEQAKAYMSALKSGPKEDVAMIVWRKTNAATKDTGHATVIVGHLDTGAPSLEVSKDDAAEIGGYRQTQAVGYYPGQSSWVDDASYREHMERARGNVAADDPIAHAEGMGVRNALIPHTAAGLTALAGGATVASKDLSLGKTILGIAGAAGIAYTAGRLTGIKKSTIGTVMMKEDEGFHGALATLITPAQKDILEHTLEGLHQTYSGHYDIIEHNCADFAEEMFAHIGLNTHAMVQEAVETEPTVTNVVRRAAKRVTLPSSMRPDRHSWAAERLNSGRQSLLNMNGQEISLRTFEISGQSSVMIQAYSQTPDSKTKKKRAEFFCKPGHTPQPENILDQLKNTVKNNKAEPWKARSEDVLDDVFNAALRLKQVGDHQDTQFDFSPHVKSVPSAGMQK